MGSTDKTAIQPTKQAAKFLDDSMKHSQRPTAEDTTQEFQDVKLSPLPTKYLVESLDPLSGQPTVDKDDDNEDDDWEKINTTELLQADGELTQGAIYESPSFRAAFHEYVARYSPSDEQKRTMRAAWLILKMAGEFSYAVVSEPVFDAAEWFVRNQFGTDLESLPAELRARLMTSLPQTAANTVRVVNSIVGQSAGAAVSLSAAIALPVLEKMVPDSFMDVVAAASEARETSATTSMTMIERAPTIQPTIQPTISNDLGHGEDDDIEFIDELEGMNVGVP